MRLSRDLLLRLPTPRDWRGREIEHARQSLVRTYCWDDYSLCPPWPHLWGTGVFVDVGENDDSPPRYILTSGCNICWDEMLVRQGKMWATARVIAYDYQKVVALLEVHHKHRFVNRKTTSTALKLANDRGIQKAERDDEAALLIGYRQWFYAHRWNAQAFLPAPFEAHAVGRGMSVNYMPSLRGAPIVTRDGIVGLTIGFSNGQMSVLRADYLRAFIESALKKKEEGKPVDKPSITNRQLFYQPVFAWMKQVLTR